MAKTRAGQTNVWLRPIVAAGIAGAGVLLPLLFSAKACESANGPLSYTCAIFAIFVLMGGLALAGLVGAAVVRGWEGTGPLLAGTFVACTLAWLLAVALGRSPNLADVVPSFLLCSFPLLVGYGIGRGLARLA